MNREVHVRFCEGVGVKFPRATRPLIYTLPLQGHLPHSVLGSLEPIVWIKGCNLHFRVFPSYPTKEQAVGP